MLGMGRSFICDSEYGLKMLEGRGDDIVPCLRCNKCHIQNLTGPWISVCSVNPELGLKKRLDYMIAPPKSAKKVAIIGGGPAGMEAAITAAKRGHKVILYEKANVLGGQLLHADFVSFKWPLRDFKDYLIRQVYKSGVTVRLGTAATTAEIESTGFDAVVLAIGSEPSIPPISGAEGGGILNPLDVFGNEAGIGNRVILIGGSETSVETAMHLAELGRSVTVLTRQDKIAPDCDRIHYREVMEASWAAMPNLSFIINAQTMLIADSSVTYTGADGAQHILEADTVIVAGGMKSRQAEAIRFYGTACQFAIIGDCQRVGSVQSAVRSAFAAASEL